MVDGTEGFFGPMSNPVRSPKPQILMTKWYLLSE